MIGALPIPAMARVAFRHPELDEAAYQELIGIPGAEPWHPRGKRRITMAPYTAAHAVGRMMVRLGVQAVPTVPEVRPLRAWTAAEAAHVKAEIVERAVALGVRPWVFDSFMLPFQYRCIGFAWERGRSHVWAEPGAGKTLIAIVAAVLMRLPVIVVTLSAAVGQTCDEWRRFTRWDPHEYRAPSRRRKKDEDLGVYVDRCMGAGDCPVVIIGWDLLRDHHAALLELLPRAVVVFDEAQRAKGWKRAKWIVNADGSLNRTDLECMSTAAFRLAHAAAGVICTTATPIANTLVDMWGQLTLVEPYGWGSTARRFQLRYCGATPNPFGGLDVDGLNRTHVDELNARLRWTSIRIPYDESHGSLPAKRRMLIRVRPEDQIKEVAGYAREINKTEKEARAGHKGAILKAATLRVARASSRKRKAVAETMAGYAGMGKGKCVVLTGWRKDAEDLAKRLSKGAAHVWMGHGGTSADAREEIRRAYMAHPGPCILVGTWHAWGTALNLDDTDVIAFAMLPFTPAEIAQAEGRGDRISMTRPLLYVYFVAEGTIDDRVVDVVLRKLEAVDAVTPGGRLHAHGGVTRALTGVDDVDTLADEMLAAMETDWMTTEDP